MTQGWEAWEEVLGVNDVRAWFGRLPAFHDAEVDSVNLSSGSGATLTIHAFEMADEVDGNGYFVQQKHALVRFHLQGVGNVALEDFDQGSILDQVTIAKNDQGLLLEFSSHIGVSGSLEAKKISVRVEPLAPKSPKS